jgi:hypothetical protein
MANDLSTSLQELLVDLLEPLDEAARDPPALIDWLASLGHTDAVAGHPTLLQIAQHAQTVIRKLKAFDARTLKTASGLISLFATGREVAAISQELRDFAADPARSQFAEELAEEVMSFLLASHLRRMHPTAFRIAALLTLIDARETAAMDPPVVVSDTTLRYARVLDRFRFATLNGLVHQPGTTLKAIYFPNDLAQGFDAWLGAQRLFQNLAFLADTLDLSWRTEIRPNLPRPPPQEPDPDDPIHDLADASDPEHPTLEETDETGGPVSAVLPPVSDDYYAANDPVFRLDIPDDVGSDIALDILMVSSRHPGGIAGLIMALTGDFNRTKTRGKWKQTFSASGAIPALSLGPNGLARVPADNPIGKGNAKLLIERIPDADSAGFAFLFGSPQGTRVEIGTLKFDGNLAFGPKKWAVSLGLAASSSALVLAPSDGDGFLRSVLPANDMRAEFDLGLAWSNERGFSLSGNSGLDATLPVGLSIGGVSVPTVHLGLHVNDVRLQAEVSASIGLSIGPVHALVDRVGITTLVSFPEKGGNLGVADLDIGFKPPSGVGIKIDSPFVTGGGFLSFEKDQYAGTMLLNIEGGIAVTAVGVIATKLPNHAKGFSFVVMITAQGFKPIPLGLGFTLTAIGGLLAINRSCNEEFLLEGIQNNTLNHLLFPKDPIRNAPQIFGTLNKAFPPKTGSYLFGPVVQICWGTPPVLTMDLGLVLELGTKRRLIVLGRVSAIMPSEKHDLIRLQMNALGVIDFDQKSISLDAVLYNSRLIGKFPITGSMAMRLRWGSAPIFALSIGGFHPAFKPPPSFPILKRLAISLSNTDNFRLRIECYLAITSNTLQFGAKVELMARAGRFSIEGRLSFDVLIQFDPFFFQADFQARVQLKLHSHNLFSVDVKGQLSGPRPLHIKGKATFGIWWCHFSVRFDKTLVEGERPPRLEAVNVIDKLKAALSDSGNWSGQLAEADRRAVALREVAATVQIVLHPLGRLSVKQNVVPLELEISKFGNTTPAGARLFTINSLTLDGNETQFSRVKDFFAPAQFLDLSEDEKLAAPSFEAMTAGIIVGAESFLFTRNADILKDSNILEDDKNGYETIIVDKEFEAENPKPRKSQRLFFIDAEFLDRNISLGAAARSDIRRTGSAKYRFRPTGDESRTGPPAGKNLLDKKGWTIASTEDGSHQGAPGLEAGQVVSYSESFQALQKLKRENPAKARTLMLIRVSAS